MRGYRLAFSLSGPRSVPSDIFGDLHAYQQTTLDTRRKSVSRPSASAKDYRYGPISVDWVDFGLPYNPAMSAPNAPGPSASASRSSSNNALGAEFIPSKHATTPGIAFGTATLGEGIIRLFRENGSDSNASGSSVAQDDGTMLAVLAVPTFMTPADFLTYIAPAEEGLAHLRLVRDVSENRSIALLKFRSRDDSEEFAQAYNGREFNSIEPETCHVVRVTSITVNAVDNATSSLLQTPTRGHTDVHELPTCPVCLERMDSAVTGLVTVPCAHTFHCQCLSKWGDSRCPVCRYSQALLTSHPRTSGSTRSIPFASTTDPRSLSTCSSCASTTNLWICLICGNVGCGRYGRAHAHQHYTQTTHLYALELETQRVWDYAGDGYVHRLIQNRADGKLVELPSASAMTPSFTSLASSTTNTSSSSRQTGPGPADALAAEKVEAIGIEYSYLLTSQLDSQRAFYEEQQVRQARELEEMRARLAKAEAEARDNAEAELRQRARAEEKALEDRALRAEARAEKSTSLARRLDKELKDERAVSAGLMETVTAMKAKSALTETEQARLRADLEEMKGQLRDLMFYIDARDKIEHAATNGDTGSGLGEAAGGSVTVAAAANEAALDAVRSTPNKKKGKKKK